MADELSYKFVAIDGAHDELLGRGATLILARALYRAAIAVYPSRDIELRRGARIVEKTERTEQPPSLRPT